MTLVAELRRRGVFGALIAYGVAAAGLLQLLDIVTHAMDAPPWTMRVVVWLAAAGLPVTLVVSWFFDLTRRGFVRTQAPAGRVRTPPLPAAAFTEPPPSIAVGSVLAGRYRLERSLGSGGMGQVFAALDTKLGRRVAIKVVTLLHDPGRVQRFEQEARAAGALEHPNLLSVYDLGEEQGVPFLVTELLEGKTLRGVVAQPDAPLSPDQVVGLALQLARGLGAAHARGVVHRDLKPENIFVTADGRLKILDFGLAKLTSMDDTTPAPGLTATGAVFGTAGYLSPEQARGERAGPASDVFAAGAVIYELLTGLRAFPGESLVEAAHAAMKSAPPPLPDSIPAQLQTIVLRALEKDPAKRFRDGTELARAIEGQPLAASVRAVDVSRPARRHGRAGWYAAAATVALAAAVVSALLVGRSASQKAPWWAKEEDFLALERDFARTRRHAQAPEPPVPPEPAHQGALPFDPSTLPQLDPKTFPGVPVAALRGADWALVSGARGLWRNDRKEQAERMLRKWIEKRPDFVPARLELFAMLCRDGRRGEANGLLPGAAETLPRGNWYATLVKTYRGGASDQDVLNAASATADEEEDEDDKAQRVAEAEYYLGLLRATDSPPDLATARKYFEKSIEKDTDGPQAGFAREELSSLERALAGSGR
ncbi:MAG: serine/threonine-protein kinase [Myxococcales bacterium]